MARVKVGFFTPEEDQIIKEYFGKVVHSVLAKKLPNRPWNSVRKRAKKLGLSTPGRSHMVTIAKQKYSHDETFFTTPNPIASYWAGFLAADGCIYEKHKALMLNVAERDSGHVERFAKAIKFDGRLTITKHLGATPQTTIRIFNATKVIKDLGENYSITPRKSKTLEPPKALDVANSFAFIIGYIDGDGSIQITSQGYLKIFIRGTKPLLSWLVHWLEALVANHDSKTRYPKSTLKNYKSDSTFTYTITGKRAVIVAKALRGLPVPKLERKWSLADSFEL